MNTRKYVLKKEDIERMKGEEITHFLNPNAIRVNKSLGDAVGMFQMGVHMIYIQPQRESTEFHRHHYEEECLYVLSGTGKLTIEKDSYPVAPGDFMGLPGNVAAHTLFNDGDEELVCLVMGQRLQHDVADYPNQSKRLFRNSGKVELVEYKNIKPAKTHTGFKIDND
ncbi:MAG: cupin domain-containing protein [Thiotrichaceae bacterium]